MLVNTVAGRRKDENVRQNPKVALTAMDPNDPYRWVDVRGFVEVIVPDEGNANINAHAKLYAGAESYYGDFAPAERCLLYTSPSPRDRTRSRMPSSA